MTYPYKCNKCRTRNLFKKPLGEYVRPKHCKACGHSKFYFDKERAKPVKPCTCWGYHFPHRVGSPCCDSNPSCSENRAKRAGCQPEDIEEARLDDIRRSKLDAAREKLNRCPDALDLEELIEQWDFPGSM